MKNNILYIVAFIVLSVFVSSCVDDLNVTPINPQKSQVFNQEEVFAKTYASFTLTGQEGPAGNSDIAGLDEGRFSVYRCLWNCMELSTDEAIWCWPDAEAIELNFNTWTTQSTSVNGMYSRLCFVITICNHFLEQTNGKTDAATIKERAEVRFLRALGYYYLMDMFGNVPFSEVVSTDAPKPILRAKLFEYVEKELLECQVDMYEPRTAPYYRVDKAAAWLLLSRLYLNAEVYTSVAASGTSAAVGGTPRWDDAAIYAKKVIDSGYVLNPSYRQLFMADNAGVIDQSTTNTAPQEIIFPIAADGIKTKSYGTSVFLIGSTHKTGMVNWGSKQNWAGNKARTSLIKKFFVINSSGTGINGFFSNGADLTTSIQPAIKDNRALFDKKSISTTVANSTPSLFSDGYQVIKFTNVRSDNGSILTIKTAGTAAAGTATYTNVTGIGSKSGIEAIFTISRDAGVYTVNVNGKGSGFIPTETITIKGTLLGGTSTANDLIITIQTVLTTTTSDIDFTDMDVPFMRVAEAYLTYAEAVLRGGTKVSGYEPLTAINALRSRASATAKATIDLQGVLDEKSREFYFEGQRRTDLIRYNQFGGATGVTWDWKGNVVGGTDFPAYFNLFPIPSTELNANPNLKQNPGY